MIDGRLLELVSEPRRAAILLDVDGTLAPIVARPSDSRVPPETQAELRRLVQRYAFVACVSGRSGADARRVVGVDGITYVGSHGLELEPAAERWRAPLQEFIAKVPWLVEDKGLTASLHYRTEPDQAAAREKLEEIAEQARAAGLRANFGRKVLELRPPVDADKGTAVRRLLRHWHVRRALYCGDDTTDLDGFRGLRESRLRLAMCVAVASDEGPPELAAQADIVVEGTQGALALLREL